MLTIIIVLGAFFRLVQIGSFSLWMDEIWSIEIATGRASLHNHLPVDAIQDDQIDFTTLKDAAPWWIIWSSMSDVIHPPLYNVALRWWMDVLGSGPAQTRLFSTLLSMAGLLVFFDICRMLQKPRQALMATGIMALSIAQIDFAQQTRNYALLTLFLLGAADALVRIELLGPRLHRLAALSLGLAAAALTHYFSAGVLIALALYAVVRLRGHARRQTMIAFAVAALLVAGLWGPWLIPQLRSVPSLMPDFVVEVGPAHIVRTLRRLSRLPAQFLFGEDEGGVLPTPAVILTAIAALGLLVSAIWRRELLLWGLWALSGIGLILVLDLARQSTLLAFIRYTIAASPAIFALIGSFDWPSRSILKNLFGLGLIIWLGVVCTRRVNEGVRPRQDWLAMAGYIQKYARADDLLVFYSDDVWNSPGTSYMAVRYYLPHSHRPWLLLSQPAGDALQKELEPRQVLWLIGRFPDREGPILLPGWKVTGTLAASPGVILCRMTPSKADLSHE